MLVTLSRNAVRFPHPHASPLPLPPQPTLPLSRYFFAARSPARFPVSVSALHDRYCGSYYGNPRTTLSYPRTMLVQCTLYEQQHKAPIPMAAPAAGPLRSAVKRYRVFFQPERRAIIISLISLARYITRPNSSNEAAAGRKGLRLDCRIPFPAPATRARARNCGNIKVSSITMCNRVRYRY
jgi:hypothetical protein